MLPQFKKEFLNTIKSDKMIEIVEILDRANDFGLTTEVVVTALKEMQNNPEHYLPLGMRDIQCVKMILVLKKLF